MPLVYTLDFVLLLACAGFYYKAAEMEGQSGILWGGLSILVFLMTWLMLGWGWLGCLVGQAVLLMGIALVRVLRKEPP